MVPPAPHPLIKFSLYLSPVCCSSLCPVICSLCLFLVYILKKSYWFACPIWSVLDRNTVIHTAHIQNWKSNLSGNCWRQPSDKCRKLVLWPTYFNRNYKDKQSSTDTIRSFISPPIKNKLYHTPDELVHTARKAKVTSHYDLRVKVSLYTLPAWLTFPASLSTVCRGHTPAEKKPHWNKPNNDDPCDAETHADNRNFGLYLSFCGLCVIFPDKTDP